MKPDLEAIRKKLKIIQGRSIRVDWEIDYCQDIAALLEWVEKLEAVIKMFKTTIPPLLKAIAGSHSGKNLHYYTEPVFRALTTLEEAP